MKHAEISNHHDGIDLPCDTLREEPYPGCWIAKWSYRVLYMEEWTEERLLVLYTNDDVPYYRKVRSFFWSITDIARYYGS